MKQTVYFVPFSESGLENKLFAPYFHPKANVPPFDYLKTYLGDHEIEVRTIDFWDEKKVGEEELVIVFDHPPTGAYKALYHLRDRLRGKDPFPLKNRRLLEILPRFKKKILMQWESPVNNPWVYKNIQSVVSRYDETYFIPKVSGLPRFYYPQNFNHLDKEHFENTSRKFLVMMNSFSRAKGFLKQGLYNERVRALKFFAAYNEVDLYGARWEKNSAPFIKKIWKGFADDKPATMGGYTFALCFENAIWPGYITEKIFDSMAVGTIPIYWGAPDIEKDIPTSCFIDMRKFKNYEELRKFLRALAPSEIEGYKEAMRAYFQSPQFKKFTPEHFAETFLKIIHG